MELPAKSTQLVSIPQEKPKASFLLSMRMLSVFASYIVRFYVSPQLNKRSFVDIQPFGLELCRAVLDHAQAKLTVSGLEHIDAKKAYIYMSNHESLIDIPALFVASPSLMRFLTKSSLAKIPLFGYWLKNSGQVLIDRHDRAKAIEQLKAIEPRLKQGLSIWISPEGTRSADGSLGPFKKGGFYTALQIGVPIIPTYLEGTARVLKKKSLCSYAHQQVHVAFGAPIDTANYSKETINELMQKVRGSIEELKSHSRTVTSS